MGRLGTLFSFIVFLTAPAFGQAAAYPYYLKTFAGAFPLGDGGSGTAALLDFPYAAIPDAAGNLYILDAGNYRIRKLTADGKINTFAQIDILGYDMKMGSDGSLYISGSGEVVKVSTSGTESIIAGTGVAGFSGDGGLANGSQVGDCYGIALDTAGNIYFTDEFDPGMRVRMVTTDGKIKTIAGTGNHGYNGDNLPATSANLSYAVGVALDRFGNVYVADGGNHRIRKFAVGGPISTYAGANYGPPSNGQVPGSLGQPGAIWIDPNGSMYVTDEYFGVVTKISGGAMSLVAGNINLNGGLNDGPATYTDLLSPWGVSTDLAGNVLIEDSTHRVRRVTQDGIITTIAGSVHFGGDNGPAIAAYLNQPSGVALDGQGNVFIADAYNYRVRKVTADGTITTYAGGGPGLPASSGVIAAKVGLPYINGIVVDSKGAVYLAGIAQVYKIGTDGILSIIAGTGYFGDGGDGGPATAATFENVQAIALDAAGNIYLADSGSNRVRVINAISGLISPFAGTGHTGASPDGGLATSVPLNMPTALAVDAAGNVYIGESGAFKIRVVNPTGIIGTVAGNGRLGSPDGVQAAGVAFSPVSSLAVDAAGNLYAASSIFGAVYAISNGVIHQISGVSSETLTEGMPATQATFFTTSLQVDGKGDVYAADAAHNVVRKLVLDTPVSFTVLDGDKQTGSPGQTLAKPLRVQVMGRVTGVPGVAVTFTVPPGSGATLSAASTLTDANGLAAVVLTLGNQAGPVVVTASAGGTNLPKVQFTATVVTPCPVALPTVTSVNSLTDFGGLHTFAPGSWLEIKGTNLAQTTRLWTGGDFNGSNAPIQVDGVSVTIEGKPAFVEYVSPGQLDVQAPADSVTGAVPVVVMTAGTAACASTAFSANEAPIAPGVLAPASFNIGGKQYLVGLFSDGFTFVGNPNLIAGVPFRPAAPGDLITVYGIGFGPVNPASAPGTVVAGANTLVNLTISFGGVPATINYAGLAPGTVGEYQFVFAVPNVPDGDYVVAFQLGNTTVPQTVYLTVHQ